MLASPHVMWSREHTSLNLVPPRRPADAPVQNAIKRVYSLDSSGREIESSFVFSLIRKYTVDNVDSYRCETVCSWDAAPAGQHKALWCLGCTWQAAARDAAPHHPALVHDAEWLRPCALSSLLSVGCSSPARASARCMCWTSRMRPSWSFWTRYARGSGLAPSALSLLTCSAQRAVLAGRRQHPSLTETHCVTEQA